MLIYPHGLLDGERLAGCSDEAKLHFPRLAALANGFGRMKLSEREILESAYGSFQKKPTRAELVGWFKEYAENHLLLVYSGFDGTLWGQWCGVPDNALPRYKTSADNRSPAPPSEALENFDATYSAKKRERSKASGDSLDISETFGNVPKSLEDSKTFPPVVVVVGVVGERQKQVPTALSLVSPKPRHVKGRDVSGDDVESIWKLWPNKNSKQDGLEAIRKAVAHLRSTGVDNPVQELEARVRTWLAHRQRLEASGEFVASLCYAQKWFNKRRYLDEAAQPPAETVLLIDGKPVPQSQCAEEGWLPMRGETA